MQIEKSKSSIRNIFRQVLRAGIILPFIMAFSLSGCFTVLQHPAVERENYLPSEITHTDRCTVCHSNSGEYWYKNPYEMEAPYNNPHLTSWNYYYNYPWWLRDRFLETRYAASSDSASEIIPVNLRGGRRAGIDAYSPAVAPEGTNTGLGLSSISGAGDGSSKKSLPAPGIQKREGINSSSKKSSSQTRVRKKKKD